MEDLISSTVDTSRPFSSVKEAVAIFGERLLVGELYSSPKPFISDQYTSTYSSSSSPIVIKREPSSWTMLSSPTPPTPMKSPMKPSKYIEEEATTLADTLKKLEAELEKTKAELKLLKERGTETEVALATLNAELHKNMSKLAQAEAAAAGKAVAATKTVRFEIDRSSENREIIKEEENERDQYRRKMEDSRTLAHILSSPLGENDHLFGPKKYRKTVLKQKPIIPLVGDFFFFKRKGSSSTKSP